MVNPFKKFTIDNVTQKFNEINPEISLSNENPIPNLILLSHYEFKKRFVKILPNGDLDGGYANHDHLVERFFMHSVSSC